VNIWITANADFPEGRGGTPRIRNLALGLAERGHDVNLFIPYAAGYWTKGRNTQRAGVHGGVTFRFLNNSTERPRTEPGVALAKLAGQSKLLYKLFLEKRPDCIIIYNWSFYDVGPLVMLARKLGKIVIFDVTDERFDVHALGWQKSALRRINAWQAERLDRPLFQKATGFMAVSRYLLEKAKAFAGTHPMLLVPLIADLRKDPPPQTPDPNGPPTLAYVGSFIPDEGLEMLIEAVAIVRDEGHPDVRCYLIGGANDPDYHAVLTSLVGEMELTKNIVFLPSTNHAELIDLLSTMTLLVLPRPQTVVSRAGFPGKLSEYFSARRPVVTTLFGDIGEYIVDGKTGYVCPEYNAASYARTLKRAFGDRKRHTAIASEAFRMAESQFDVPHVAAKVEQFILSVSRRFDESR
jgi:glycosyltransferase involved in cell wall biosynthesis